MPPSYDLQSGRGQVVFDEPGTCVETDAEFRHATSHSWNHGLGEWQLTDRPERLAPGYALQAVT